MGVKYNDDALSNDNSTPKEQISVATDASGIISTPAQVETGEPKVPEQTQQSEDTDKRGKYHQYEDPQIIIDEIRSYRRQRYPDSEIIKKLDNMPRRTYYNYVKKMQDQDRELVEQWTTNHLEVVSEEFFIFRENSSHMLRRLQAIIDDDKNPCRERLKAMEQYFDVSDALVNQSFERISTVRFAQERAEKERRDREYWDSFHKPPAGSKQSP